MFTVYAVDKGLFILFLLLVEFGRKLNESRYSVFSQMMLYLLVIAVTIQNSYHIIREQKRDDTWRLINIELN